MSITAKTFKSAVDFNLQQGLTKKCPEEANRYWWCISGMRELVLDAEHRELHAYATAAMDQIIEHEQTLWNNKIRPVAA